jgi:hypothetical protein
VRIPAQEIVRRAAHQPRVLDGINLIGFLRSSPSSLLPAHFFSFLSNSANVSFATRKASTPAGIPQ